MPSDAQVFTLTPSSKSNANDFAIECSITCHSECTHLVPDFCGMTMEAANQILETLIRTRNHNKSASVSSGLSGGTLRPSGPPGHQDAALAYPQKPVESPQGPPKPASADALKAATNSYMVSQSPTAQRQQVPPRVPPSSTSAAAAAAVATGMRPPPQQSPGEFSCAIFFTVLDIDTYFHRYGTPNATPGSCTCPL